MVGQVPHRRDRQRSVLGVYVAQADVHRELGAVPPPSARASRGRQAAHACAFLLFRSREQKLSFETCEASLSVCRVSGLERLGHQCLDAPSDQVLAFIAEQRLRLAIDVPDHARTVYRHQGTRHGVQHALEVCRLPRHSFSLRPVQITQTVRNDFGNLQILPNRCSKCVTTSDRARKLDVPLTTLHGEAQRLVVV